MTSSAVTTTLGHVGTNVHAPYLFLLYNDKLHHIDFKNVVYHAPQKLKFGYKVPVSYRLNGVEVPLVIQTPLLYLPFGASEAKDRKDDDAKGDKVEQESERAAVWKLAYRLDTTSHRQSCFLDFMNEWDRFTMATLLEKKDEWFTNEELSIDEIKVFYNKLIGKSKKSATGFEYPPLFNTKLSYNYNTKSVVTRFFKSDETPATLAEVTPGGRGIGIVRYQGLWFGKRLIVHRFSTEGLKFDAPVAANKCPVVSAEGDDFGVAPTPTSSPRVVSADESVEPSAKRARIE